jgi:hypothetical protein
MLQKVYLPSLFPQAPRPLTTLEANQMNTVINNSGEEQELCVVDAQLLQKAMHEADGAYHRLDTVLKAIEGDHDIWDTTESSLAMTGPLLLLKEIKEKIYHELVVGIAEMREDGYEATEKKEPQKKNTRSLR